ncbi:hypothetical protein [Streptomyces bullii]|uniref:Secreted protein n=1 Tax=Streptomyces bullii TaxID=349910 RepID=A0ABW0UNF3_9ACTN
MLVLLLALITLLVTGAPVEAQAGSPPPAVSGAAVEYDAVDPALRQVPRNGRRTAAPTPSGRTPDVRRTHAAPRPGPLPPRPPYAGRCVVLRC